MSIEKELNDIWKKYDGKFTNQNIAKIFNRRFLYSETKNKKVLFVGLNPSYRENDNFKNDLDMKSFDAFLCKEDSYYKKFHEISNECGIKDNWTYTDLCYYRETEQSTTNQILKEEPIGRGFIWDQIQISKNIIENLEPKIMIVCNTMARKFFGKEKTQKKDGKWDNEWMNYTFKFDDNIGTDRIINEDSHLKNVPVFFTSMLSGQRAIDNGSYERLIWHVKQVLKKL